MLPFLNKFLLCHAHLRQNSTKSNQILKIFLFFSFHFKI